MASIRKRGSSYLIVVSMGYDYNGKRIKPQQKTVHPPEELTPKQVEKWLNEQAVLFERECRHTPQPIQQLTLAKHIDLWLTDIAPGKLAKSTIRRDRQDIERILPAPKMLCREKRGSPFIAGTGFLIPDADLLMKAKPILCWHLILITLIQESTKRS